MAIIVKNYTFTNGATIFAAEHNSNFDTLYNDYNGNITNVNISGAAGIVDTKLAQITTASKVSTASLVGSLPQAAGGMTGAMLMWATDTAPTGWLLCDGTAVSRTTYAALFAILSTTYGVGDASTTFNVPDFRGRMPLGQDDMGGSSANRVTDTDADALGGADGAETITLSTSEIPLHGHPFRFSGNSAGGADTTGGLMVDVGGSPSTKAAFTGTASDAAGEQIAGAGGGGSHNNMPPWLCVNFIIKI